MQCENDAEVYGRAMHHLDLSSVCNEHRGRALTIRAVMNDSALKPTIKPIVVLVSGRGSNLQALLTTATVERWDAALGAKIAAVVARTLERYAPELIVLAGFMRVLTPEFVRRYAGRLINIHPSLLPSFPGLNTHQRALDAGVRVHGATVHFVSEEVDAGPIIAQAAVAVHADDDKVKLAERVLQQEHRLLPQAVRHVLEGRVRYADRRVVLKDIGEGELSLLAS